MNGVIIYGINVQFVCIINKNINNEQFLDIILLPILSFFSITQVLPLELCFALKPLACPSFARYE